MKTDDLLDALGEADPTYIQEAEDVRYLGARKKHFMQMAACVALLLIGGSYGMWQQYENATHTDVAKTESAETADTYEAVASDGDMTSDAAAPDGTAESAEDYEAAAQSTAGDGNGIQEAAQPESAAGIDWYFNEVEELQTSIACGAEAAKTVSLTEEQLQNYYGIKVIPDVIPDGYVQTDEEKTYQIGYDADGNVIDDNCVMRYENSETAGWFTIRARSTDIGEMTSYVSGGLKPMTVSGVKVTAAHYPAGSSGGTFTDGYLATYKKNGVTVNVQSEGLSRDEFCALVENLLAE